jgi:type II secretory pathway pseudopilin PulG
MRYVGVLFAALLISAAPRRAQAEQCFDAPAVCLVKEGQALLKATPSNPKEAAQKFYASYQLDPVTNTLAQYAIAMSMDREYAVAYEAWQKVTALTEREATDAKALVASARSASDKAAADKAQAAFEVAANRLDNARTALADLTPKVGRVRIRFPEGRPPNGMVVTRKGVGDVDTSVTAEFVVKAGGDTLLYTYPNGTTKEIQVVIAGGNVETITAPTLDDFKPARAVVDVPGSAVEEPDEPEVPLAPSKMRLHAAYALGGTGVVMLGVAAVFEMQSRSAWSDAKSAGCTETTCPQGMAADLGDKSNSRAHLALGSAIGGVALIGAGAALYFTYSSSHSATASAWNVIPMRNGGLASWSRSF